MEAVDGSTNRKFVRLIFDPGGLLLNSRSSSFQVGDNDAYGPHDTCVGPKWI